MSIVPYTCWVQKQRILFLLTINLVKIVCHLNFSCTICKKNRRGAELRGSHRERSLRQRFKADPNILTQCLSLSSTMSWSTVSMVEVW